MDTNAPVAADNAAILAKLDALQTEITALKTPPPGAAPLAASPRIENLGNPLVEKFNSLRFDTPARAKLVGNHYEALRKELIGAQGSGINPVFASNTVDSSLANTLLSSTFITTMRNKTAVLSAFTHRVEIAPLAPRDTIKVELVSSAGSVQTNPSNFETGDTTSAPITISVTHYNRNFYASMAERNVGLALASKAPTNAKIISEGLVGAVTALMTNANFGADVNIGSAANFDYTDIPAILDYAVDYDTPTLLLSPTYWNRLPFADKAMFNIAEPGSYAISGGIHRNNLWTGGASDIVGLVCDPDAIVWGAAPAAELPQGEFITTENITLDCGVIVQAHTWFSRATRALWGSFDVCFGAAVGDATRAEVLTSQ